MPTAYRYALYLAPSGPWLDLGQRWLGRCAESGAALVSEAPEAWVAAPRRYGLHATLKAPFRLATHACPQDLDRVARAIALRQQAFALPLVLRSLRGFLAWCIAPTAAAARDTIDALAADALCAAEPLRAPLTEAELAHRLAAPLTPAQRQMLYAWGYPYALDTYVFHITLTNVLGETQLSEARQKLLTVGWVEGERSPTANAARVGLRSSTQPASVAPLASVMTVKALSIYVQPHADADFLVARHYGFDGSTRDAVGAPWLQT